MNQNKPSVETTRQQDEQDPKTIETVCRIAGKLLDRHTQYATFGSMEKYRAKQIALVGKHGEIVLIEKVLPGRAVEGRVHQDLSIWIADGPWTVDGKPVEVDFNYNQYGDKKFRKRTFTEDAIELTTPPELPIPKEMTDEDIERAEAYLHQVEESIANMDLEEHFGLNNQPATENDLFRLASIIATANVIDPRTNDIAA